MQITSGQIRAARAFLNWTAQRLADEAKVALSTIVRAEKAEGEPPVKEEILERICIALEGAGFEFTAGPVPGLRLRRSAWPKIAVAMLSSTAVWEERLQGCAVGMV